LSVLFEFRGRRGRSGAFGGGGASKIVVPRNDSFSPQRGRDGENKKDSVSLLREKGGCGKTLMWRREGRLRKSFAGP